MVFLYANFTPYQEIAISLNSNPKHSSVSKSLSIIFLQPKTTLVKFAGYPTNMDSTPLPLSSKAPEFQLPEPLTGKVWKLDDFQGHPALLVMFICNHCPFVVHLKKDIVKLAEDYMPKGLGVVAICSNSTVTYPQDGPDFMAEDAKKLGYQFPYLYDETQEAARRFGALCTPEFFLFRKDENQTFELAYHGRFDESRPGNDKPITGSDIRQAIECVLSGQPVSTAQKPSIGCSIKWHPIQNV